MEKYIAYGYFYVFTVALSHSPSFSLSHRILKVIRDFLSPHRGDYFNENGDMKIFLLLLFGVFVVKKYSNWLVRRLTLTSGRLFLDLMCLLQGNIIPKYSRNENDLGIALKRDQYNALDEMVFEMPLAMFIYKAAGNFLFVASFGFNSYFYPIFPLHTRYFSIIFAQFFFHYLTC